ncbi:uncharacterized protein [Haliotis cracherodii]|uniref:uncharacterized protein n=1 Tax=Haliotis cracherodii TaxID=6455 RepID=UPI0039EA5124
MRDNLIFVGIDETQEEDAEAVLKTFMQEQLKIEQDLVRVHRMGARRVNDQRPRPIIVKFGDFKECQHVRQAAFDQLKVEEYYVKEQFPEEIEERRKLLYPARRAANRAGDRVALTVDRLYVNGQRYVPGKALPQSNSRILVRDHTIDELRADTRRPTGTPT